MPSLCCDMQQTEMKRKVHQLPALSTPLTQLLGLLSSAVVSTEWMCAQCPAAPRPAPAEAQNHQNLHLSPMQLLGAALLQPAAAAPGPGV